MRILISSQYYHPAYALGGSVGNAVALAEGLASSGHAVAVVTTTVEDLAHRAAWRGRIEVVKGVRVHYLGTWINFRKAQFSPAILRLAYLDRIEFDWLHVVGLYDSLAPPLASLAKCRRIPYSVEPAGMLVKGTRSHGSKRVYHWAIGKRLLRQANAIVVTSRKEWLDAIEFGCDPGQIRIRRNGVHVADYAHRPARGLFRRQLGVPMDAPLVLFIGRVDPMKNLENLLQACAGLKDRGCHLAVVGPTECGAYAEGLRGQANDLGISSLVHWSPPLYGDGKLSAFADADVVALVSRSENWGNVVQEAVAANVPVVVTDTCGVAEVVGETAGVVVTTSPVAVRDGLERMLFDREFRAKVMAGLPGLAQRLSWEEPIRFMSNMADAWIHPRAAGTSE